MRKIENVRDYVLELLNKGADPKYYKKYARVKAVQVQEEKQVTTVMKDGHIEVDGVFAEKSDWIVTNPDGEQYVVHHADFVKKYEVEADAEGYHLPIGAPIQAIPVNEDIVFDVPWGKNRSLIPFELKKDGYLVIPANPKSSIYGIQKMEFFNTYSICNEKGIFKDESLRKAFGQEEENGDTENS